MRRDVRAIARFVLLPALLLVLGAILVQEIRARPETFLQLHPLPFGLAVLGVSWGLVASAKAWQTLVEGKRPLAVAQAFFLSQAGKYLPGGVWQGIGQAGLTHTAGVPFGRAVLALPIHAAVQILGALPLASAGIASTAELPLPARAGAVLLLLPLFALHPTVLVRVLERASRWAPESVPWKAIDAHRIRRSARWSMVSWLGFGLAFASCIRMLGWESTGAGTLAAGFALAWIGGFLVVFVPAGAGVREATLLLLLGGSVPAGVLLTAAIAYRLATIVAELGLSLATTIARRLFDRDATGSGSPPTICLAGTWDRAFGRNRTLQRLLEREGYRIVRCQVDLWGPRGDAIVRRPKRALLRGALVAYPRLVWRFLRMPRPDLVIVPYPGHFDVPLLAPLCRLRGIPLAFDVFLSLYDTIVGDRRLAGERTPVAWAARAIDRLACRLADRIFVDTPCHARYFAGLGGIAPERFRVLWVGAEDDVFRPRPEVAPERGLVLFYGTLIPLHGVETIVRAVAALAADGIRVRLIGDGQDRDVVESLGRTLGTTNLERVGMRPLDELPGEIARAAICLGIFGTSGKADRVVPHKVFECLAVGRPVITGDTSAIRSAFAPGDLVTVPVGDAAALARAIRRLHENPDEAEAVAATGHRRYREDYREEVLARLLRRHLDELLAPS